MKVFFLLAIVSSSFVRYGDLLEADIESWTSYTNLFWCSNLNHWPTPSWTRLWYS